MTFSHKDFAPQQPPLSAVSTARPAVWRRRTGDKLAEVADLLCCTLRQRSACRCAGCRDQGWLDWSPRQGGGRRSRLTLLDNQESLTRRRLRELLSGAKLAQGGAAGGRSSGTPAHPAAHRAARSGHPGGARSCGCLTTGHCPGCCPPARCAALKSHLSRQGFFQRPDLANEENRGEIPRGSRPPLGVSGPPPWRYLLRPAVRFHHGRELVVEDVTESLQSLRDRPAVRPSGAAGEPWPRTPGSAPRQPGSCCPTCWPSRWPSSCRASSWGGGLCPAAGGHRPIG